MLIIKNVGLKITNLSFLHSYQSFFILIPSSFKRSLLLLNYLWYCKGREMKTWFVSRHPGAIEWIKTQKHIKIDEFVTHLDIEAINKGDTIIGILPFDIAATLCKKGGIFYALLLNQNEDNRGQEHSAQKMHQLGARLQRFRAEAFEEL